MGKKSKLKAIKKMAALMPTIETVKKVGTVVSGSELIEKGVVSIADESVPVLPNHKYKKQEFKKVPVNHEKEMKRVYNRYGAAGVKQYAIEAARYVERQEKADLSEVIAKKDVEEIQQKVFDSEDVVSDRPDDKIVLPLL